MHFPSLESTNDYALAMIEEGEVAEGTVISTDEQTRGRGQMGSRWMSEGGKNITLSVVLRPRFLTANRHFLLNQMSSLAILDAVGGLLESPLRVKWPNDIYAGSRKLAGILIQTSISGHFLQYATIGMGINVNQIEFPGGLPNPTSLRLERGEPMERQALMRSLLSALERRYLDLRAGHYGALSKAYADKLYRKDEMIRFERRDGSPFEGRILGVGPGGKLEVATPDAIEEFDIKEIAYK
ncbi:MAG: biotin--[acetyl-CoA-carboxylase] ligase [Saprospiraceae bacterium]|nr:biotin--[acetyl-CoA-carboxylase] ligase [Saprospiraceae bacterium]